jgi:hypothetical protein
MSAERYQIWVWHSGPERCWSRGQIVDTEQAAKAAVRQIERFYGTAADYERIEIAGPWPMQGEAGAR